MVAQTEKLVLTIGAQRISALLQVSSHVRACYVMAHGAGAGMTHPFLESIAAGLCVNGIATLRFQFPYMERGSKRPDPPKLAHATIREAVAVAAVRLPGVSLVAGGRSYGGRMASQAQAASPLENVRGLAFLGFPLHAANAPSDERAQHLSAVQVPMLFLQGTRDALAEISLLKQLIVRLGSRSSLVLFEGADHAFHVPAHSGRKDSEILSELIDTLTRWIASLSEPDATKQADSDLWV
jgi:predicted alpha/beta-hydrolase family hydrolase